MPSPSFPKIYPLTQNQIDFTFSQQNSSIITHCVLRNFKMAASEDHRNSSSPTPSKYNKSIQLENVAAEKGHNGDNLIVEGADYSGAARKTDPAEIALVRKLDRMIMVCSYMSISQNHTDREANYLGYVLSELSRSECTSSGTSEHSRGGPEPQRCPV